MKTRTLLEVLFVVLLAGCAKEVPAPEPGPRPVVVGEVGSGPAVPPVVTNGMVAPRDELRLAFKVGGVVNRIRVREGDTVKRGQELATLDLREIDAEVEQASQIAAKAERDRVRGDELRAARLISEGDAERLRTDAQVTSARLRAARFNRQYAVITAPQDGVVLRRRAEEQQVLTPGQDVLVLGPVGGGFVVRAGLADRDVVKLRSGDRARVALDAWPGVELAGRVSEIPGAASDDTGLFDIEVTLDAAPVKLVSGLLARVTIEPAMASESRLPYVPVAAIVEADGEHAAVFVPVDGVARRRSVQVAFIAADAVAIRSGLEPGDSVITGGALYLADGERIVRATAP